MLKRILYVLLTAVFAIALTACGSSDEDDAADAEEQGELLQTFLLDKEMYEKIWIDKSMEIEIGPMRNADAEDISKGHEVTFDLK